MPRGRPARAPYGSGSVSEIKPNRWRLTVSLGSDPITGKHRRATKLVTAKSRKDALEELARFRSGDPTGTTNDSLTKTFADYLEACVDMSPGTRADYESYISRYVPEHLATRRVRDITTHDLDQLYGHLRRKGGVCRKRKEKCTTATCAHGGGDPLSSATVDRLHTILHAALEQAVRWDYISTNPASRTRSHAVEHDEVALPPADDLVRLLAAIDALPLDDPDNIARHRGPSGRVLARTSVDPSPLPDFTALLLGSGVRPGELCALPWGDVDLDPAQVDGDGNRYAVLTIDQSLSRAKGGAVVKPTKTNRGRKVTVPADVVDVLERRLSRWRPAVLATGMPIDEFPVFPSPARPRSPWRPDSMSRELRTLRDSLDLDETLTMRNFRHYCVSVLAANGVDVVTAAKRHGHSPTIMLKVYAHVLGDSDVRAAGVLAANLAKVKSR